MTQRYIIIGTDTNCGKTYVTCQLSQYLKKNEQTVLAIKPVASGGKWQNGILINGDLEKLQAVNEDFKKPICKWQFQPAISPHIAAAQLGKTISAEEIVRFCVNPRFAPRSHLLIETAGGLMSPLNTEQTWVDVLKISQIPAIMVVGIRLGCLNHALLTASVMQQHAIPCVGWIANVLNSRTQRVPENIQILQEKLPWPLLTMIGYQGRVTNNFSLLLDKSGHAV